MTAPLLKLDVILTSAKIFLFRVRENLGELRPQIPGKDVLCTLRVQEDSGTLPHTLPGSWSPLAPPGKIHDSRV